MTTVRSKLEIPHLAEEGQIFVVLEDGLDYVIVLVNDGAELKLYEDEFEIL